MAGGLLALLAGVSALVGLLLLRRGSFLWVALAAGASVGLAWIAVGTVKRGLPRGVQGGAPPAEVVRAQMWRYMPRLLGVCGLALLTSLCGFVALYRPYEEIPLQQ